MTEKNAPSVQSSWRVDALVITLFAVGTVLAVAVGSSRALGSGPNLFGSWGEVGAGWLLDPLGWAAIVLLAGWFAVAALLIVRRTTLRLITRVLGWGTVTISTAVGVDWFGMGLPAPTVAGRGGSVGAYLRFGLEDATEPGIALAVLALVTLVGLALVADRLVVAVARVSWVVLRAVWRGAVWVNDRVADAMEAVIGRVAKVLNVIGRSALSVAKGALAVVPARKAVSPAASTMHVAPITKIGPASVSTATPAPVRSPIPPESSPEDDAAPETKPEDIPIHVHAGSKLAPLLRAVPPLDEPLSTIEYELPSLSLLNDPEPFPVEDHEQKLREMAVLLEKTFQDFGLNVKVVGIHTGPVITQYEITLETGMRLNKVTTLADDLALNLRVASVRVVAPLPGRNTVGIEVPNEIRQTVQLKELVGALAHTPKVSKFKLPLFVGKDVEGRPLAFDLATMPHLLIAGSTGTGKSVCLNTIIVSLLLTRRPDECRMILIDPKKVELSDYAQIPHLMTPVVKEDKKADAILAWAVDKMEERYEWLHRARVRNIASYNELPFEEIARRVNPDSEDELRAIPRKMPYIVIVIDEVGDLMMKMKKEIEGNIILLAQKSRAAGIHLILATQKPTVDVVTGLIKSNMPARICFRVTNRSDSAVVLDEKGGERLLGKGDMLFLQTGVLTRAQGAFVEDQEIERVVGAIATDTPSYDNELLNLKTREQVEAANSGGEVGEKLRERDPVYEQAVEIVIREQRGSTSLLQRALGIGYGKASRLIDYMAEDGIVGGFNGSNARQVLILPDEWEARKRAVPAG
ncbi:DNA translocase FtsK [Gemmata sp. G18]|uniref:DNA translocase FtsK n=1 Tax=Gemmata palustris TaxID=2822762 RepID=A0ABS5BZY6_9BACT|nr:DNA translocase FtsK [Gemmata palustris]MBP3959254.1 DNA translocase FtsK [Gemmata palustris]